MTAASNEQLNTVCPIFVL